MTRHITREKAMISVYQYLVMNRKIEELIQDNFEGDEQEDAYMLEVVETAINNQARYASYINEVLNGWTFDRLGYVEQAILLNGCAEFDLKQEQAAVIINEYVDLTKKFCDRDSYKLVNGVLDVI